eukprot:GHVS01051523.1.p1 GENE.GHVS01051523.1~~GHVS01051523.1.p1  ORF type:complete len:1071 (+),score=225.04 GHVS01051523.1:265-3477(+)
MLLVFVVFLFLPVVICGPLDAFLPVSVLKAIEASDLSDLLSTVDLNKELISLSTNLSNLRASATSVASSLLSAQAVHAELSDLLEYVQSVRKLQQLEIDVEKRLKALEEAVGNARDGVGRIGGALEVLLKERGGTEELLKKLVGDVSDLVKSLKLLEKVKGLELVKIIKGLRLFGSSGILSDTAAAINKSKDKVFEVVDDLAGTGLSSSKVLQIVDLRGGFGKPIKLPGDLGHLNLTREGLNEQFVDLGAKKIYGQIAENVGLNTDLNIAGLGVSGDGHVRDVLDATGQIDLSKIGGSILNDINFEQNLDLGKLGLGSTGAGIRTDIDGVLNLKDKFGEVELEGSRGSGLDFAGKLGDVGIGDSGVLNMDAKIDLKDLTSHLGVFGGSGIGGGLKLGDDVGSGGGFGERGSFISNIDLKKLTGNTDLHHDSGLGGSVDIGSASIVGGIGHLIDSTTNINLKEGLVGLDLLSEGGTDGNIRLPGNLGGLMYDIQDITRIGGHIDLKNLSLRSLEILKQTDIIAVVDLPGDRLDDITIDLHPKIDTANVGKLNVLGFASKFAEDVKKITDFNMLSESNLVKAITSGCEFLARLDILDALRKDIGTIVALPEVATRVKAVVTDMESIYGALMRVKVFPATVRALGKALEKFDVGQLVIELPELEALAVPRKDGGSSGDVVQDIIMGAEHLAAEKAKGEVAIPHAAESLSKFRLGAFMEAADLVEKITGAAENLDFYYGKKDGGLKESLLKGLPVLTNGMNAMTTISKVGDVVQSIAGVDIAKVVEVADIAKLDFNDLSNLSSIMKLTQLDETFRTPLGNLIRIANLQEVELNELGDISKLANLNLNDLNDLSDILDTDLEELDLFDIGLTEELDRMLIEPLEDIVTDALGNAVIDIDLGGIDIKKIIETAKIAHIDINDLDELDKMGSLLGMKGDKLDELESFVRAANWNGVDLSKVPMLADLSGLNLGKLDDLQTIVGNAEIGKALEVLEVNEVAKVLKDVQLSNVVSKSGEALSDVIKNSPINADQVSKLASDVLKSDFAAEMAASVSSMLRTAVGGRRLRALKQRKQKNQ